MTASLVEDRDAIRQSVYLYCRAMDRMDHELAYTLWHDGAEVDYGEGVYRGSARGFIDFVMQAHGRMLAHSHQVTNVIIELEGDQAASESYLTAALRQERDGQLVQVTTRGRYLDRWARRDGRWAITRRLYLHDFDEVRPVTPTAMPTRGRRDRDDLSYGVLGGAAP